MTHDDPRARLAAGLTEAWADACAGAPGAQARLQTAEGGAWQWGLEGLQLSGSGAEWSGVTWDLGSDALRELRNFAIEVSVSGKAGAAGLSFGPYKDFLVPLEPQAPPRRLQLEIDLEADRWAFRVDGRAARREWWDAGVTGVAALATPLIGLKARHLDQVVFHDLAFHTFSSSCQLSVVITCNRFLQRLRVTLRNWCSQQIDRGSYEVLIVNPDSPDGTHEHLAAVARSYPEIRVREIAAEAGLANNKGALINRAFRESRGAWIWLTDADCLFGPASAALALAHIRGRPDRLFFGERRYLDQAHTDALLAGRLDGLADFDTLAAGPHARRPEHAPWGYTQIVHRSVFERIPYREHINHYAHSDNLFIEACRRQRVLPEPVGGLFCLHLDHPFAWYGTSSFL